MQIALLKDNYNYVLDIVNNYFKQTTTVENLKENTIFVLKDNEKQVGFIIFSIVIDTADIYFLYIDKKYRSKNLGYFLSLESINYLKQNFNVKEFFLEVNVNNTKAINLYNRLDFKKIRIIKNYYEDGSDAICMKLGDKNEDFSV